MSARFAGLNPGSSGIYSTADLAVMLERPHPSRLTEAIRLLVREGVLLRLRRGLYADRLNGYRPEMAGQRWLAPSYLSTESALGRHGLCQTGVTALTYVTRRLIAGRGQALRTVEGHQFMYRRLAPHLYFGYEAAADAVLVAQPEKAVLDFLYFLHKGQRSAMAPSDIDFTRLAKSRYRYYLKAYRQAGFESFALDLLLERGER